MTFLLLRVDPKHEVTLRCTRTHEHTHTHARTHPHTVLLISSSLAPMRSGAREWNTCTGNVLPGTDTTGASKKRANFSVCSVAEATSTFSSGLLGREKRNGYGCVHACVCGEGKATAAPLLHCVLEQTEEHVRVDAPLVGLVKHHGAVPAQQRVPHALAHQAAVGEEHDAGARGRAVVEADDVADGVAHGGAVLMRARGVGEGEPHGGRGGGTTHARVRAHGRWGAQRISSRGRRAARRRRRRLGGAA